MPHITTNIESPALEALIAEYLKFQVDNGITLGSADDHLFDESLTGAQRDWLGDYSRRWEMAVEEPHLKLPARWVICSWCEGCGTDRGRSVECDGGGFTSSEWADQDEDFREGYLSGRYDRRCDACEGTGKVLEVDRDRCKPELLALYDAEQKEEAEFQALCAAERRMGA